MAATVDDIVSQALALPFPVRVLLAEKLLESLDTMPSPELSPEWREEIRRRCKEIQEGTAVLREADDVFAAADARLG
jgi:hypothetical protein